MSHSQQFCTFLLKDWLFGIPVEQVLEVIQYQNVTRVPLAPEVVRGLINLRGQIVAAVDLRLRLGMEKPPHGKRPVNVVVRTPEGPVSLLVDSIGDVVAAEDATFERPPGTLARHLRGLVVGVYKLDQRLLHVLNTNAASAPPEATESGANR